MSLSRLHETELKFPPEDAQLPAMTNATRRTPFHSPMRTARVTITLLVILMLGTNSVASQTTSASDSTNVVTSDWAFRLTESKADTVVTRHFAAPSAFQLEKGEGQVQSNLILNVASFGLSDHVSASCIVGGPFVLGAGLGVKTSHPIGGKVRWSLGGGVATETGGEIMYNSMKPLAMGFTTLSFGDPDKNVSLSVGLTNRAFPGGRRFYVYSDEEREVARALIDAGSSTALTSYVYPNTRYYRASTRFLTLSLCAMWPLASRVILISENHFFSDKYFSELEQDTFNSSSPNQGYSVSVNYYMSHIYERGAAWNGEGVNQFVIGSLGFRTWSARRPITFDAGLIVAPEGGLVLTPWFSVSKGFRPNF